MISTELQVEKNKKQKAIFVHGLNLNKWYVGESQKLLQKQNRPLEMWYQRVHKESERVSCLLH